MFAKVIFVLLVMVLVPTNAFAYIGPGAGITAIGTVIALIGAILLGIVGFVWYPMKRVRAKKKKRMEKIDEGPSPS